MKKTISIILTLLFALTLASCGAVNKKIAGTYELTKAEGGKMNVTDEQLQLFREMGTTATLTVREDGTASMDFFGLKTEATYDVSKMVFDIDGDKVKFTFSGDKITLSQNGTTMVFTRTD